MNIPSLAIIGGGRWGRVHRLVAERSGLPIGRIVTVSRHGTGELKSLEELLANPPTAAIVANSAREHFATARALLEAGAQVLVEKPVVLEPAEAEQLQELANARGRCLMPGLNFRFCSYLERFARRLGERGPARTVTVEWADASGEVRHGETKNYDASISIADDIMPHGWTILSVLFPGRTFTIESGHSAHRDDARFVIRAGALAGKIHLVRAAPARQRRVTVTTEHGETLALDFANEPGMIADGAASFSGDEAWASRPSPLTRQLRHFFDCIASGKTSKADGDALRESVAFSHAAAQLLLKQVGR